MADSVIPITAGAGTSVDTRTESTNSHHRQVVVLGDPSVNDGVAEVRGSDPASNTVGVVVRDVNTSAIVSALNGTLTVKLDPGHELGSVKQINSSVAVYFEGSEPTVKAKYGSGTFAVSLDPGYELGSIKGINSSVAVYFDRSGPTVNNSATMCVGSAGGSVSGQYVGISDLGVTLVSPEANHNTKVYAFSIITTAQVQIVPKFTNGAGAATELWRVALQAPTQGISGVSQSIQPPGYLFATGVNTTLALRLDSASLVHYSISYFKESA